MPDNDNPTTDVCLLGGERLTIDGSLGDVSRKVEQGEWVTLTDTYGDDVRVHIAAILYMRETAPLQDFVK